MKLKVKNLDIGTGNPLIALMNINDAKHYDLHFADRINVKNKNKKITCILDITHSNDLIKEGEIGLFKEVSSEIKTKNKEEVSIKIERKPKSIELIKKKMKGCELKDDELFIIIDDIIKGNLNEIEMSYFVASTYIHELSDKEIIALTNSIVKTGNVLNLKSKIIVDKHCIGGVAGNRTTMVVIPIIAAAGLIMPKTSSRSITSASGTADTVEVLCDVSFGINKMKKIIKKTNACMVWGGAMNLAPADDKIIKVEHSMSLDPVGQLLASILAKKKSVSATHVLIDIPIGIGCKTSCDKRANLLKNKFEKIGKKLGMKIKAIITDGSNPIGNGIGPALEAKEVLYTLMNSKKGSIPLKNKSIEMAGIILEMAGKAKKGKGKKLAQDIFDSGDAYKKFIEILKAQNAKITDPDKIKSAKYKKNILADKDGIITHINNDLINKIARIAGCPHDKYAGIYMYKNKNEYVKNKEKLFTIYSDSKERLKYAIQYHLNNNAYEIIIKKLIKTKK
ncbi:MAG: AMP phosphorylase [Candidatus Woesearchaeota archaeon]